MSWAPEDLDVLIDMLDDSMRRWFAAQSLLNVLWLGVLSDDQRSRVGDMLGTQTDTHLLAAALRDVIATGKPIRSTHLSNVPPRKSWVYRGYLFETAEAARAYEDFVAWRKEARGW